MENYSELCRRYREVLSSMFTARRLCVDEEIKLWNHLIDASVAFSMGASVCTYKLSRDDFGLDKTGCDLWKQLAAFLKPFIALGWVTPVIHGRKVVEYRFEKNLFNETKFRQIHDRRRATRRKEDPPPQIFIKESVRNVEVFRTPPRNKVEPSVSIIVDIANLTKHSGPNGSISPEEINWGRLRTVLAMHNGKSYPIERAVICVSDVYYRNNHRALMQAGEYFAIEKMEGDKDSDPVVIAQLIDVVESHLLPKSKYADRIPAIVLASGDKDFSYIVDALRVGATREGLSLALRVVAWKSDTGGRLERRASDFLWMENIAPFLKLEGVRSRACA